MSAIDNLKALLDSGQESALLQYALGNAYLKEDKPDLAVEHLSRALELDPEYSAAWKMYGKALTANDQTKEAVRAYETGIEVAEKKGDIQAVKEMNVFLKRLQKQ